MLVHFDKTDIPFRLVLYSGEWPLLYPVNGEQTDSKISLPVRLPFVIE